MQDRRVDRPDLQFDGAGVLERIAQRDLVPPKRGRPMSTVNTRSETRRRGSSPALVSKQERLAGRAAHDGVGQHRPGDAAGAVAAGARFRAVGVVDAQVGVRAGRRGSCTTMSWSKCERGSAAMARASAALTRTAVPRRSSTTISLPRPFIFRKRRFARGLMGLVCGG